jgi:hypothetical protein
MKQFFNKSWSLDFFIHNIIAIFDIRFRFERDVSKGGPELRQGLVHRRASHLAVSRPRRQRPRGSADDAEPQQHQQVQDQCPHQCRLCRHPGLGGER